MRSELIQQLPDCQEGLRKTEHGHQNKGGGFIKEETNKGQPEHPTCCLEHKQHKEVLNYLSFVAFKAFLGGKPTKGRESTPEQLK